MLNFSTDIADMFDMDLFSRTSPRRPALALAWLAGCLLGLGALWAHALAPAPKADAPPRWPDGTALPRVAGRPALVLLAHPRCPCTSASFTQLGWIMSRAPRAATVSIVFVKPAGAPAGWERTSLWRQARALRAATLLKDDSGAEAARFGAQASGQALLYDSEGRLVFSGGLTSARGHAGDSAGRSAVLALLRSKGRPSTAPVFGCALRHGG
jgi:hypothetical protein